MAGKTDTLENALLNLIWRGTAFPYTSALWLGLGQISSPAPQEDGTGFTELSLSTPSNGYARVQLSTAYASPAVAGVIQNNVAAIDIGPASGADWATVRYVGFFRNATGTATTDLLAWAQLQNDVTVLDGQTFRFETNNLKWTED